MPPPEPTSWVEKIELVRLRRWLYCGPTYVPWPKVPDRRRDGCLLIQAWKWRGNLPHAVESTALLTEVMLVDETDTFSFNAIRLAYSGAISRFVTGLLDSDKKERHRTSMHQKATQLGFPGPLVDLRHEIVHEGLPSLEILRQAAQRSLQWLWDDYWMKLTPLMPPDPPAALKDGDIPKLKEKFRGILRSYFREACNAKKRNDRQGTLVPGHVADRASLELVKICENHHAVVTELAVVMLESKFLVPGSQKLHDPMDDFFPLWDPLIKKLSAHQRCFLDLLVDQMARQMVLRTNMDVSIDEYREAITLWLERIFVSKGYTAAVKRAKISYGDIMLTCIYNVNCWTVRLARRIMEAPQHEIVKNVYAGRLEVIWSEFGGEKRHVQENADGSTLVGKDDGGKEGEWDPAQHGGPNPFGTVQP